MHSFMWWFLNSYSRRWVLLTVLSFLLLVIYNIDQHIYNMNHQHSVGGFPGTWRIMTISLLVSTLMLGKLLTSTELKSPTSVTHALEINAKNRTTFWRDAIGKEMTHVPVTFQILVVGYNLFPCYSKLSGHLIFDVKMDIMKDQPTDPKGSTYASVVSRESIRIALTYTAFNSIEYWCYDSWHTKSFSKNNTRLFAVLSLARIVASKRALYGGKSAGVDFWNHLWEYMMHLGNKSC